MRVSQGGHDVPTEKLVSRFPRTLANLKAAIRELPCVLVFDNADLEHPFRKGAVFERAEMAFGAPANRFRICKKLRSSADIPKSEPLACEKVA